MKDNVDLLCTCEHPKSVHSEEDDMMCLAFGDDTTVEECPCYVFKFNKLGYLEAIYDAKTK